MPVPTSISELSTTPGSNSPSGSESPSVLDDYHRTAFAFIRQVSDAAFLPGDVKWQAHTTVAAGWLACNGAAVSRATYAALFAVIGTTWGAGDGSSTFNLPDSRNRTLVGSGSLYTVGVTGGSKDATLVSHSHTASTGGHSADHVHTGLTDAAGVHAHAPLGGGAFYTSAGGAGNFGGGAIPVSTPTSTADSGNHSHSFTTVGASNDHTHAVTVNANGSSATDANLPPYAAMLACIKF